MILQYSNVGGNRLVHWSSNLHCSLTCAFKLPNRALPYCHTLPVTEKREGWCTSDPGVLQQISLQAEEASTSAKERTADIRSRLSHRRDEHDAKVSKLDAELAVAKQPALVSHQEQAAVVSRLQEEIEELRWKSFSLQKARLKSGGGKAFLPVQN